MTTPPRRLVTPERREDDAATRVGLIRLGLKEFAR
jgi:hypothetical protein